MTKNNTTTDTTADQKKESTQPAGDNRGLTDTDGNKSAGDVKSPGPRSPEVESGDEAP